MIAALSIVPVLFVLALILAAFFDRHWKQDSHSYPMRPLDNRERRAAWAIKHYLQNEAMPNTFFHFNQRKAE